MRNVILFILLTLLSVGNLFGQKKDITSEYFLKPLIKEIQAESPYTKPEITDELIFESLRRAASDCETCFEILKEGDNSEVLVNGQESKAENNPYQINFADYISVGDYSLKRYYIGRFIGNYESGPYVQDFKSFKSYESTRLKEAGIKKKAEQEIVYTKLIEKRKQLGTLLAKFYHDYDYKVDIYNTLKKKCKELLGEEEFILEKISPYFNSLDNLLIYPKYSTKKNTFEENEMLKKKLIEEGLVEIIEWRKPSSDGYTFIFPKISEKLENRVKTLNGYGYFRLSNTYKARWYFAKQRILRLWYGSLDNAFALENFLAVCGSNVPSKEDFKNDENNEDKLKDLIEEYISLLNGRVGGGFKYDETLKKYPKYILYDNIVNNHYGIKDQELKGIRKQQSALLEKEQSEKGGLLRGNRYFKINEQGKFDIYYFTSSLWLTREINQSKYGGSFLKNSDNTYTIELKDTKTGIKLPAFKARLSSDGKKLYIGGDKIPYKLKNSNGANCLKNKRDVWRSSDGTESFTTIGRSEWKSTITGGIKTSGILYKISSNKYAFVVDTTSWGGKLDNNLIIITTSNDCNTIYYGKGKKKMLAN